MGIKAERRKIVAQAIKGLGWQLTADKLLARPKGTRLDLSTNILRITRKHRQDLSDRHRDMLIELADAIAPARGRPTKVQGIINRAMGKGPSRPRGRRRTIPSRDMMRDAVKFIQERDVRLGLPKPSAQRAIQEVLEKAYPERSRYSLKGTAKQYVKRLHDKS